MKHIVIHPHDTDDEARARHKRIEARLNEFGETNVRMLAGIAGFPTQWDPIIAAWLKGERLET